MGIISTLLNFICKTYIYILISSNINIFMFQLWKTKKNLRINFYIFYNGKGCGIKFYTYCFAAKLSTLWFLYLRVHVMILQKQGTQTIWWFYSLLLSSSLLLFSAYLKFKSVEDIKWERKKGEKRYLDGCPNILDFFCTKSIWIKSIIRNHFLWTKYKQKSLGKLNIRQHIL